MVIDNATFHKGGRIEQLIQEAGCQLRYLPAYSPNFNRIERCLSWPGSRYATQLDQFECLRDATLAYPTQGRPAPTKAVAISPHDLVDMVKTAPLV